MKRLALLLAVLLSGCGPTITADESALRLIAEKGQVRLEAAAPILWARVALKGEVISPYCELPGCAAEDGVVYLALPPVEGKLYAPMLAVARSEGLQAGVAIATLEGADVTHRAALETAP